MSGFENQRGSLQSSNTSPGALSTVPAPFLLLVTCSTFFHLLPSLSSSPFIPSPCVKDHSPKNSPSRPALRSCPQPCLIPGSWSSRALLIPTPKQTSIRSPRTRPVLSLTPTSTVLSSQLHNGILLLEQKVIDALTFCSTQTKPLHSVSSAFDGCCLDVL